MPCSGPRMPLDTEIDEVTDCWHFTGAKNNIGYGMIRDEKKMRTTHRVSYEEHNDQKIPRYMCVCHTCDNTLCVNPKHLWLGTRTDNTHDMISKGRHRFFGGKTMDGFVHKKYECKYCKRMVAKHAITRWHDEKCKHKTQA